jgi:hypothetical protein
VRGAGAPGFARFRERTNGFGGAFVIFEWKEIQTCGGGAAIISFGGANAANRL